MNPGLIVEELDLDMLCRASSVREKSNDEFTTDRDDQDWSFFCAFHCIEQESRQRVSMPQPLGPTSSAVIDDM